MVIAFWPAAAFCLTLLSLHLASVFIAVIRCRVRADDTPPPYGSAVSLIRPLCGIDNYCEETLRSSFELDYPRYEIIFCVASAKDPVTPMVERMIAAHPQVQARLLIGNERISDNPKLNNLFKGWRAATHEWIVIADSNVLMSRDYVQRLLASWRPDTGLICSPPIGCLPSGFWAEMECAFLNTYQARWQYCADTIGFGFAQGKTMLWRRDELERAGGLRALTTEIAEDAAATKVVRQNGKRVRLVDGPFNQPLGYRTAIEVWRRQVRWARLRRAAFKLYYASEIVSSGVWPIMTSGFLATAMDLPPLGCMAGFAVIWYGAEALLAYAAGWPLSPRSPVVWMIRDLLLPPLWIAGWFGNGFVWRGNEMRLGESREAF
jgi:ceramide glucosyltransferase